MGKPSEAELRKLRRGQVVWVDFRGSVGAEQGKTRPAVVVSSDRLNNVLRSIIVIPISGLKDKKPFPHEVVIPSGEGGLTEESVAQPIQIRTIDRGERVVGILGELKSDTMNAISSRLSDVLGGLF